MVFELLSLESDITIENRGLVERYTIESITRMRSDPCIASLPREFLSQSTLTIHDCNAPLSDHDSDAFKNARGRTTGDDQGHSRAMHRQWKGNVSGWNTFTGIPLTIFG